MKNILKHIEENNYAKAYLLYGEEDYLKRMYKHKLVNAISGDDSMNYSYYEGKDTDVNDIKDTSFTMPFFAERRLIVIEDSGMFKTSSEAMADVVKEAPETTIFVFVDSEVDKRNKLFKTVNDVGYVCEMKSQTEADLSNWVRRIFRESGRDISDRDRALFIAKSGFNMDNLRNEADKLIAYTEGRNIITSADIDAVCVTQTEDRVFDMINAIATKDRGKVMRLYGDLLALKEAPLKILALLGKQFSTLLAVREMLDLGHGSSMITERLGIRPYFAGRYISQAKGFSAKELRNAVEDCVEAEEGIKTGRWDDTYAVELIILKYSR